MESNCTPAASGGVAGDSGIVVRPGSSSSVSRGNGSEACGAVGVDLELGVLEGLVDLGDQGVVAREGVVADLLGGGEEQVVVGVGGETAEFGHFPGRLDDGRREVAVLTGPAGVHVAAVARVVGGLVAGVAALDERIELGERGKHGGGGLHLGICSAVCTFSQFLYKFNPFYKNGLNVISEI